MKPHWRKRLDKVASSINPHTKGVMFIQHENESDAELDQRVARWEAGEKVEGVDQSYTGRESCVWIFKPVKPPKRDE